MAKEEQNWETDIRLIQKDIMQIQKFFNKVDASIDMMGELSKTVAVQHEVLKNTAEKLDMVETLCKETKDTDAERSVLLGNKLEEYRASSYADHQRLAASTAQRRVEINKELLDKLDSMEKNLHLRVNDQSKKINALENWKYYAMGMGAVILLLMARINWPQLFS